MAYDQSDTEEFSYTDATFGGTTVTHQIIGPKGAVGFVEDISVDVTTSLVGTTTVPEIDIGISSGDATYGRYRLGITAGGANQGYTLGMHRASEEPWTGNPPRTFADYTGHVVLDGGPLDSNQRVPLGRIPAGGMPVSNVLNGTGNNARVFLNLSVMPQNLVVGQVVGIRAIAGATASGLTSGTLLDGLGTISVINTTANWIELSGTTFGGTYTSGGVISPVAFVTCAQGVGSPAGGGQVRIKIRWMKAESP
jgi:hypothetical protein